jgi:hypothetical protein
METITQSWEEEMKLKPMQEKPKSHRTKVRAEASKAFGHRY